MEYLALLRQPNFAKLWFAQIFSQLSQSLLNFALIIVVFDLVQGSRFANLSVALLVLAFGLPALLFGPIAGAYVDHWDRKYVLVISNLLRVGLALTYITVDDNLWLLLLISFFFSSILQFFVPAETAMIPNVVPKKLLLAANSLFIFSVYGGFIVGYSASGPAIRLFGEDGPFKVVAVFLVIATILTALLPRQKAVRATGKLPRPHLIEHMRENWKLIKGNRDRQFSILQLTATQSIVSVLVTLAPALSLALLHVPLEQASHVLIIPVGVGMLLGVLLVSSVTKAKAKIVVIQACLIIAAVTLTLVGLSGQLYRVYDGNTIVPVASIAMIVAILMLVLGLINAMISAMAQTLLQESTGDENRGKIFASLNMMINLAATVPILIAGLLADLLSVTKVITLLGIIMTAYAIYMVWHYRPSGIAPPSEND